MNLRNIDLNLLVFFDALMQTRHVSRAAARLGVGQSGMSAALKRLRELFHDPLLVRQGHEMMPTARALALEAEVRKVLRDVEHLVGPPGDFRPGESERGFRLRMSDLLTSLLLPGLVERLGRTAPRVKLTIDHLPPDRTVDALGRDGLDVAVSTGLEIPKSVRVATLYEDRVVCVARRGLAVDRTLADAESFAKAPQVRVSRSPLDTRFADRHLTRLGLSRNVAITVPHWMAVPDIVCSTSLIAAVPATFAHYLAERFPLDVHGLDFFETGFHWSLYWHDRYHGDPAHRWFRSVLVETCANRPSAAPPGRGVSPGPGAGAGSPGEAEPGGGGRGPSG